MPRTPTDWISLAEAAEMLSAAGVPISTSTLGRWAREGRLQHIRPGRRVYVRKAQVRALLTPRRGVRVDADQAGLFEDWSG